MALYYYSQNILEKVQLILLKYTWPEQIWACLVCALTCLYPNSIIVVDVMVVWPKKWFWLYIHHRKTLRKALQLKITVKQEKSAKLQ